MKKALALILVLMMALTMFVACGKKEEGGEAVEVKGEVYDTGVISVLVPEGWKEFPVMDIWSDENEIDPSSVQICKDADDDLDLLTNPYVLVTYYDADTFMMTPDSSWYENVEEIDSFTAAGYTWEGFSGESLGYPITILWAEDGDDQFQVNMWTKTENGEISLDDADVQAILNSIKITK